MAEEAPNKRVRPRREPGCARRCATAAALAAACRREPKSFPADVYRPGPRRRGRGRSCRRWSAWPTCWNASAAWPQRSPSAMIYPAILLVAAIGSDLVAADPGAAAIRAALRPERGRTAGLDPVPARRGQLVPAYGLCAAGGAASGCCARRAQARTDRAGRRPAAAAPAPLGGLSRKSWPPASPARSACCWSTACRCWRRWPSSATCWATAPRRLAVERAEDDARRGRF